MKFATRKEQRKVIETIDAVILPLIPHLKKDEADAVQTAITILRDVEVESEDMRDATEEERKSTKDYIDSISKPTGLQFDDIYEELDFVQPHKKTSVNLQPCEDCISREEAKKLIQGKIDDISKNKDGTYGSMFGQYVNGLYCAKTAISYMSSAVPQTKRGKWIKTSLTQISGGDFNRGFKCSCCDYVVVVDDFNYCPNCGAKMVESEEKE